MKVYFVGAGPGDPELLTVKARRLVEGCRCCVYAGSLVSPEVVALIPADADRHDSASLTLEQLAAVYAAARDRDIDVVRLHSGDPSIFGAIGEQMRELERLAIDYEVVPGVSSFQAAAAALRTELTAPEVAQTVILTRTAGRTPMPPEQDIERLAASHATLCIFLSTHKAREVAETLAKHYGADCPAAIVYHASWPDEAVIRGTLADIAARVEGSGIRKTALILVGRALAAGEGASKLYDRQFTHEFRKGGEE